MSKTGWDIANETKDKKGARINLWKDSDRVVKNIEIVAPRGGSVNVPPGHLRPSMEGFVRRVIAILFPVLLTLCAMTGGYWVLAVGR